MDARGFRPQPRSRGSRGKTFLSTRPHRLRLRVLHGNATCGVRLQGCCAGTGARERKTGKEGRLTQAISWINAWIAFAFFAPPRDLSCSAAGQAGSQFVPLTLSNMEHGGQATTAVKAATLKEGDVVKFSRPVLGCSRSKFPEDYAAFMSANLALPIGTPSHNLHAPCPMMTTPLTGGHLECHGVCVASAVHAR